MFASPEDMESFIDQAPEEQRLQILGLSASYMAFGGASRAVGKGLNALAKKFPVLTKTNISGY